MKKLFIIVIMILSVQFIFSQSKNATVEKSIFGIQTGFLGVWAHNEQKLNNTIALRSELGFDSGIFGGDYYDSTNFILFPTITIEPRWYYNLNKRVKKGKSIIKNSSNFIGLRLNYIPDWFVISNLDNVSVIDNVSIIPKWAIKRTYGNHFTIESGIGIGYRVYFLKNHGYFSNESETAIDLHLRIGYSF